METRSKMFTFVYMFNIFDFLHFCDVTHDYMVGHGHAETILTYIAYELL